MMTIKLKNFDHMDKIIKGYCKKHHTRTIEFASFNVGDGTIVNYITFEWAPSRTVRFVRPADAE